MTEPAPLAAATEPAPPSPVFGAEASEAGRLISRTFAVWRSNLFRFAASTLLLATLPLLAGCVVLYRVYATTAAARTSASAMAGFALLTFAILLIGAAAAWAVGTGALAHGAAQHLAGRRVRLGEMLAAGLRRALPLAGLGILAGAMTLAGLIALFVPGLCIACAVGVAAPAAMAEKLGPIAAIRRSFELSREHRLAFFFAALAIGTVVLGADQAAWFAMRLLFGSSVATTLIAVAVHLLFMSLPVLLPAVAYHQLRAAQEGFAPDPGDVEREPALGFPADRR